MNLTNDSSALDVHTRTLKALVEYISYFYGCTTDTNIRRANVISKEFNERFSEADKQQNARIQSLNTLDSTGQAQVRGPVTFDLLDKLRVDKLRYDYDVANAPAGSIVPAVDDSVLGFIASTKPFVASNTDYSVIFFSLLKIFGKFFKISTDSMQGAYVGGPVVPASYTPVGIGDSYFKKGIGSTSMNPIVHLVLNGNNGSFVTGDFTVADARNFKIESVQVYDPLEDSNYAGTSGNLDLNKLSVLMEQLMIQAGWSNTSYYGDPYVIAAGPSGDSNAASNLFIQNYNTLTATPVPSKADFGWVSSYFKNRYANIDSSGIYVEFWSVGTPSRRYCIYLDLDILITKTDDGNSSFVTFDFVGGIQQPVQSGPDCSDGSQALLAIMNEMYSNVPVTIGASYFTPLMAKVVAARQKFFTDNTNYLGMTA